ncbi:MAG: hypothetical protein GWO22_12930, partial [Actinobacteria bacterium]|nr:hypothetical protein [Actinomycetota bacterium]
MAVTGLREPGESNLGWVDPDGNVEIVHEPWAEELGDIHEVALSPDGRRAVASVHLAPNLAQTGDDEIWVFDLENRTANPIAFDAVTPVGWLGSDRIVYQTRVGG